MMITKNELQQFTTVVIKDKYISDTHTALYIKKDNNLYSNTTGEHTCLVSATDVLDYANQLLEEGSCIKKIDLLTNTLHIH